MKHVFRLITALAFLLLLGTISYANEFRGLYVDAFHPGFKTHEQVTQMVTSAKGANFNALIVQVRKRGDAYYNSKIEPKASDIAADYDPLADIVTQAHAVGMEVHAWLSVYEVALDSKWSRPAASAIHLAHPEWLMTDATGRSAFANGKIFLDPGIPQVRSYLVSVVTDILSNYAVDGINLDNLRYASPDFGYNPISVSLFNEALGKSGIPKARDEAWMQWRRNQVTALVSQVHEAIAEAKPNVKLSVSVMGPNPAEASEWYLQEWKAWTATGIVDFLIPMAYTAGNAMQEKASLALGSSYDRHIYIGIAGYRISAQLANAQVGACRSAAARGVVFYSYHYMGPNSTNAECAKLPALASGTFSQPAVVPAMAWKE